MGPINRMNPDKVHFFPLSEYINQIKRLHQLVMGEDKWEDYRHSDVHVSRIIRRGEKLEEQIFWHGAEHHDVRKFMNSFIAAYKSTSLSLIHTNPFLKSALIHLLFVRIHPFTDGNGRTARMIHNIKFTEGINKIYGSKLKICPLNISQNILLNQRTYANRLDDIYFDLDHDSNDEINKWFHFVLDMADEQLYFSMNRLPKLAKSFCTIDSLKGTDHSSISTNIEKMKIKYQ